MSELTTAVQRALEAEHPHVALSVDEEAVEGAKRLAVIGVDYKRAGSELTALCADLFARSNALSNLPVSVSVQGMGDAGRTLDTELDNLAAYLGKEYGVDALVVFTWEHGGPEFGQLEAVTDDPIQTAILSAVINAESS
jgi:predicted dienelactone hydrolase